MLSIDQAMRRHFITMTAAAKRMSALASRMIVTLTASAQRDRLELRHIGRGEGPLWGYGLLNLLEFRSQTP